MQLVMLWYAMSCYVMLWYAMLCYVMCVMLCYDLLCYVMIYYVMICYVILCYVILCYVILCYVMLCYVMLCYAVLCYLMLCYVMYVPLYLLQLKDSKVVALAQLLERSNSSYYSSFNSIMCDVVAGERFLHPLTYFSTQVLE